MTYLLFGNFCVVISSPWLFLTSKQCQILSFFPCFLLSTHIFQPRFIYQCCLPSLFCDFLSGLFFFLTPIPLTHCCQISLKIELWSASGPFSDSSQPNEKSLDFGVTLKTNNTWFWPLLSVSSALFYRHADTWLFSIFLGLIYLPLPASVLEAMSLSISVLFSFQANLKHHSICSTESEWIVFSFMFLFLMPSEYQL